MGDDGWSPEIVVGIDFGMTCTGVAWSRQPAWVDPKPFQHWPGKMISELANKVPTLLSYETGSSTLKGWGFICDQYGSQGDEESELIDCFKLHLDPSFKEDPRPNRPSTQQARRWYRDYLQGIHSHIAEVFQDSVPGWRDQNVEFVFSVPTTWKSPSMIADIEQVLRDAGFGRDSPHHRAKIGLTEAEAAAIYASKQQQYKKDDVILICDAGGGTTDVNLLKVKSQPGQPISLEPLSWVEGRPVGSIAIDTEFHKLILSRLNRVQDYLREDPFLIAGRMMREGGVFERFKCSFGSKLTNVMPTFQLQVPELPEGLSLPEAMIENSSMVFSRDDLRTIFDIQINKILALTDEQIGRVSSKHPDCQISYLVLSGGFGSSPYMKERLRSHYTTGPGATRQAVSNMKVVSVEEPQLAVIQGLVIHKIQMINFGTEVFVSRCSRQSYGVLCSEKYQPGSKRHLGHPVRIDPLDGVTWVDGQIQWFIEQGATVPLDGVTKPFSLTRSLGAEFEPWQTQIIVSSFAKDDLPTNVKQDGAERLCKISSFLKSQEVDMKLKNRHWYNRGKKYWRFRFDIKAVVGAADLRFVMLTKDKKVIKSENNAIEVIWEPAAEPALQNNTPITGMPLYHFDS